MEFASDALYLKDKLARQSKFIHGCLPRTGVAAAAPVEPAVLLEEIAVWVNEGGGGGEVRR